MLKRQPVTDGYTMVVEQLVGMSCNEFFETFFQDDAALGFDKFLEDRGELKLNRENWKKPDQSCEEECNQDLPSTVLQYRKIFAEF